MKYILGIDVGTTGTKTILFSLDGTPLAHAYRSYPLINSGVGESEQNADDWWRAIVDTVREVCQGRAEKEEVCAISLSTQGGTLVPVDKDGNPLRSAIVWNDVRFTDERERFISEIGSAELLYNKSGWRLGRGLPLLAIRYIKDKEPEIFQKTDKFLTVPSYVSLKMTGKAKTDISNAGIEQLTDVRCADYDPELMRFAGVRKEQLAEIVPSGKAIGNLTRVAASELGLSENTILVSGAHDQYAVALGAGAVRAGDILIGSGTCWVVTAIGDKADFESGIAQSVSAVQGLWGTLRSLSTGGVCLEWLRNNVCANADGGVIDYDTFNREVSAVRAAEDGLFFYPFRGTFGKNQSFTKGSFVGLDLSHNRFHLARAIMEGVVFQILWMMEDFKTKPSKDGITLAGGASKSSIWPQILADASGLPIRIPEVADLACVGAAIMAGVGAGVYTSCEDGYKSFSVKERVVMPNLELTEIYRDILKKYKKQAEALGASY